MKNRFLTIITFAACVLAAQAAQAAGWSSASAISPTLQPDPTRGSQLSDMAVNSSGVTIAAWDQFSYSGTGGATIGAAVQSGGKWSAPFTISGLSGFSLAPKVAVGPDGTMAVSWTHQDPMGVAGSQQRIQVAVRPAGATAWTTTTLAQGPLGGTVSTQFIPVAIDANGNVTACWSIWDGARHVVQAATRPAGDAWSAPANVAPGIDGLYLNLAVNARGDAALVYSLSPYTAIGGTAAHYVFRSGPAGTWTAPVMVSELMPATTGYITSPLVGLDGNGLATVVYVGREVKGTREVAPGVWTPQQTVFTPPNAASYFASIDLATDASGNSVAAVTIFDASINVNRASVWVASGSAAGDWTASHRLTDPTKTDAYVARAAVSPDGKLALLGWIDHYQGKVQISQLNNGVWGTARTIARGTARSSFQEVLSLDAGSGTAARATWKTARNGTKILSANYLP